MNFFKMNLKKPVHLLFIFLLVILISCKEMPKENGTDYPSSEPTKEMLAHIIPTGKAIDMHRNYAGERIALLRDTLKGKYGDDFEDTRKLWLSLKELKNYIAYMEKRSKEQNITPDGLLFYLGVYNEDDKYKNQQTFFIAPTTKENSETSGYTLESRDGQTQVVFLKNIMKRNNDPTHVQEQGDTQRAGFFLNLQEDDKGLLYNNTQNSPPANLN